MKIRLHKSSGREPSILPRPAVIIVPTTKGTSAVANCSRHHVGRHFCAKLTMDIIDCTEHVLSDFDSWSHSEFDQADLHSINLLISIK